MSSRMSSREAILNSLRGSAVPPAARPAPLSGIRYADPRKQFEESLIAVGGRFIRGGDPAGLDLYANAAKVASLVPSIPSRNVDLHAIQDPHELDGIDVAVIPGEFAVAENGAVWVPGETLAPHRAIFVIAQHLVLVVPGDQVVDNLHQAYQRIQWRPNSFGVFISGPSKTADIEQSLVMGAHGARSCTVILL
jgi:L-lactate dehydrogenase complex protein LldG